MTSKKTKIAVGVGTGLLAAGTAAGYYFFASKTAKKNRKIVASWATKLKRDTEKHIKVLKKMDKTAVIKMINKAAAAYKGVEDVSAKDLAAAVTELKRNWKKMVKTK